MPARRGRSRTPKRKKKSHVHMSSKHFKYTAATAPDRMSYGIGKRSMASRGRMGRGVPRTKKWAYGQIRRLPTHTKNCFTRRFSSRRHPYYVPKRIYFQSCGYDAATGKIYHPGRRLQYRRKVQRKWGMVRGRHNYKSYARAYKRYKSFRRTLGR